MASSVQSKEQSGLPPHAPAGYFHPTWTLSGASTYALTRDGTTVLPGWASAPGHCMCHLGRWAGVHDMDVSWAKVQILAPCGRFEAFPWPQAALLARPPLWVCCQNTLSWRWQCLHPAPPRHSVAVAGILQSMGSTDQCHEVLVFPHQELPMRASLVVAQVVKNSPAMWETQV